MPSLLSITALFTIPDQVRQAVLDTPDYALVNQGERGQNLFIQKVFKTLDHDVDSLLIKRIKEVLEECLTCKKLLEFRTTGTPPSSVLSPEVFEKVLNEELPSLPDALTPTTLEKISYSWTKAFQTSHTHTEKRNARLDKAGHTLQHQLGLSNTQWKFLVNHFVTAYPTLDSAAHAFCSFVDSIPLKTKTLSRLTDYLQQQTPDPQTLSPEDRTLLVNLSTHLPLLERILASANFFPPAQTQFLKACLQSHLVIFRFKQHLDLMFTHPNYSVNQMTKQMQTAFNKPQDLKQVKLSNGSTFPLRETCRKDLHRHPGKMEFINHMDNTRFSFKPLSETSGVVLDDFGIKLQKLPVHTPRFDDRLNYLLQTLISQEGFVPTHQTLAGSSVESPYMAEQRGMHTEIHQDSPDQIRIVYTRKESLLSMEDIEKDDRKGFATASYRYHYTLKRNYFGNWSCSTSPFVQESFAFDPTADECFRARHFTTKLSDIQVVS
jgi:hypothetical protein